MTDKGERGDRTVRETVGGACSSENGAKTGFVAVSPAMARLARTVERLAAQPFGLLLTGERGVGKTTIAAHIHRASGRKGRFVVVSCATLQPTLVESELFGTERGAYTGAVERVGLCAHAGEGTLLLDEMQAVDVAVQAKLLRLLEERVYRPVGGVQDVAVRCRFVAAMNEDPKDLVAAGRLRPDLRDRLGFAVHVPRLCERAEDIPVLARRFVQGLARAGYSVVRSISDGALARLQEHSWPGNIRELKSFIEHLCALADGEEITAAHVATLLPSAPPTEPETAASNGHSPVPGATAEEAERQRLIELLRETRGNISEVARRLGTYRKYVQRAMRKFGLRREDFR